MEKEKRLSPGLPKGFQDRWGQTLFLKKELLRIIEKSYLIVGLMSNELSLQLQIEFLYTYLHYACLETNYKFA